MGTTRKQLLSLPSGNYRPVNLISVSGNVMEQILLEIISSLVKDKKVTGCHQHGFIKWKSCLINLEIFSDGGQEESSGYCLS